MIEMRRRKAYLRTGSQHKQPSFLPSHLLTHFVCKRHKRQETNKQTGRLAIASSASQDAYHTHTHTHKIGGDMSSHNAFHYSASRSLLSPSPFYTLFSLSRSMNLSSPSINHSHLYRPGINQHNRPSLPKFHPMPTVPNPSPAISINAQNASCKISKSIDPFPTTQPSMCPSPAINP